MEVSEADGDGLGSPPKHVAVTMEHDATAGEVEDVLAAYADDLADGSVAVLALALDGFPSGTLEVGQTTTRTSDTVSALVTAATEPGVEAIEIDDFGEGLDVRLDLHQGRLDRASTVMAQYWERLEPTTDAMADASLIVQSDGFRIVRSKGLAKPLLARIAFAREVDRRHRLVGAAISAKVLELRVRSASEVDVVRRILGQLPGKHEVGTVRVVRESVDLSGATGALRDDARRVVNEIRHDGAFDFARIRNGELQIGASTMEDAMTLDSYFDSGIDPLHRAIALRYLLEDGSDFGKRAGSMMRHYRPATLAEQAQWSRFSVTEGENESVVRVHARRGVSLRDAAAALAVVNARRSTVLWPDGRPPLTLTAVGREGREVSIEGALSDAERAQVAAGWADGTP